MFLPDSCNSKIILNTIYSGIVLKYFLNCAIQNMADLQIRRDKIASSFVCVCVCIKEKISYQSIT